MKRSLPGAALALLLLAGCSGTTPVVTINLQKAQAEAAIVVSSLDNAAAAYPAAAQYLGVLNAAALAFQAVQNGAETGPQLAANVVNAAQVLVNALPQLDAQTKANVDIALGVVGAFAAGLTQAPPAAATLVAPTS